MKTLANIIIGIGLVIFGYSISLEPYTNEIEFDEKCMALTGDDRSAQYFDLREQYLTSKYVLVDYGLTITNVGLILLILYYKGWSEFKTPKSKGNIMGLGVFAVLITTMAYVADMFTEMARGSSPPWADSMGIPLMSVPPIFILLLIWSGLNMIGLRWGFETGVPFSNFKFKKINYWYLVISILTLVIVFTVIIEGTFWMIIPGCLWLYFYLSLLLGRQTRKTNKIKH